jgi:hypothetical protein
MARNRHSWEKRAKELARKAKAEEKMKRRQSRSQGQSAEKLPEDRKEDA